LDELVSRGHASDPLAHEQWHARYKELAERSRRMSAEVSRLADWLHEIERP
jgi:hypothetical protein